VERVNILKYKKKFPPPRRGRARVGVEMGFFHTFPFQRGKRLNSPESLLPLKKGGREGFLGKLFQNAKVLQEFKSEQTKKGHVRIVSAGDGDIHRSINSPRR
jgi:hypothetical protein